jgi:tetratricopeptide (TPR) repeat protein
VVESSRLGAIRWIMIALREATIHSLVDHLASTGAVVNEEPSSEIESLRDRACLLEESGDYEAAAQLWEEFVQKHPEDANAINELGTVLVCTGRFDEALSCFRRALEPCPDLISAKTNVGVALRYLNRLREAVSQFEEVANIAPYDAVACFNLGTTLYLLRRYDQALPWLQRAYDLCPSQAECARELGKVLLKLNRNEEATLAYRRVVCLKPDCIEALLSLGGLLQIARQFDEASEIFQKVVDLDPNHCNGWLNLGTALLRVRRHAESLAAFRRALAIQPGSAIGYCNMSLALAGLGRLHEAIDACRKAIFIEPGMPVATFNMGTMLLTLGSFREGWQAYHYRYTMHGEKWLCDEAHAAPWTGEDLAGKSILILGEQGNGDEIQFARYLPALKDLGAYVSYLARRKLHRLFHTLNGSITLLSEIPQNSRFDFQCPLMNLPGVFENLGLPIPNKTPYLAAEPGRVAKWKSRIGDHGFRIGIIWQGNQDDGFYVRSYPPYALQPLAEIPGVRLISLQINGGTEQLENLPPGMRIERLDPDFDTGEDAFVDSAAVIEVLDLIITCDTSIAHLSGALGRPIWIALSEAPEWRWQRHRDDSVWYPTARLFRQEEKDDWKSLFLRMAGALAEVLGNGAITAINDIPNPPQSRPRVEVSWGELLDKISILEIKANRMTSFASVANVRREMEHLNSVLAALTPLPSEVQKKRSFLRVTNEKLWDLEDAIRACEADQRFDSNFVELARKIYVFNDERAKMKQQINILMNSTFIEEKEYMADLSTNVASRAFKRTAPTVIDS